MIIFARLSPGPTIPELMQVEWAAWLDSVLDSVAAGLSHTHRRRMAAHWRMRVCLSAAALVLVGARVLLRLRLIEPGFAARAFHLAAGLSRAGLAFWRQGRSRAPLRGR